MKGRLNINTTRRYRILSLMTALVLLLSMIPLSVVADDDTWFSAVTPIKGLKLIDGNDLEIVTDAENAPYLFPGETMQMKVSPASYTAESWSSKNESVAVVDDTGLVTALSPGTTLVTVTVLGGFKQEYQVVVLNRDTVYTIHYHVEYPDNAYTFVFQKGDGFSGPSKPEDTTFDVDFKGLIPGEKVELNDGSLVQTVNYTVTGWEDRKGNTYGTGEKIPLYGNLDLYAIFEEGSIHVDGTVMLNNQYYTDSNKWNNYVKSNAIKFTQNGTEYRMFMIGANQSINFYYKDTYLNPNKQPPEPYEIKLLGFKLHPGRNAGIPQEYLDKTFAPGELVTLPAIPNGNMYCFMPVFSTDTDDNLSTVVVIRKGVSLSKQKDYDDHYYYYVGQAKLTKEAKEALDNAPYGVKGIDGSHDEWHIYSTNGSVGNMASYDTYLPSKYYDAKTLPSMKQILAALGETVDSEAAYKVTYFKIGRTGKGYTLDGVLHKVGVSHVVTFVDVVTGKVVQQYTVDDESFMNLSETANGLKSNYTDFTYVGAFQTPTADETQRVSKDPVAIYKDCTIYLVYKSNSQQVYHTVQFLDENGEATYYESDGNRGVYYQYIPHGDAGTVAPSPKKEGYTFQGWYTELNQGGDKLTSQLDSVKQDWIFYASFTRDTGTLTIRKNLTVDENTTFKVRISGFKPGEQVAGRTAGNDGTLTVEVPANGACVLEEVPTGTYSLEEVLLGSQSTKYEPSYPDGQTVTIGAKEKIEFTVANRPVIEIEITGNVVRETYKGAEWKAEGYTAACSSPLYDESRIVLDGKAEVAKTDCGVYPMGLTEERFSYSDDKLKAVFTVKDGLLEIRPAEVTVQADDKQKEYGQPDPKLTAGITGLVGRDVGKTELIAYEIGRKAGEEPGAYPITPAGEENQGNYHVVYLPGTLTILPRTETLASVSVVWEDENNLDGIRPERLAVTLLADGSEADNAEVSGAVNWRTALTGLPLHNGDKDIAYTWTAVTPDGYTLVSNVTEGTHTTITYRHVIPEIELTVRKVWEDENNKAGNRPENLTVYLYGNDRVISTVTLVPAQDWKASVTVPATSGGKAIDYRWIEPAIPGYTLTGNVTTGTETVLTNRAETPEPVNYTLTIYYRDTDGNTVAPTYTGTYRAGEQYRIVSPEVAGYQVGTPVVQGTMPERDLEIVVLYFRTNPAGGGNPDNPVVIMEDYGTPLGLGQVTVNVGEAFE